MGAAARAEAAATNKRHCSKLQPKRETLRDLAGSKLECSAVEISSRRSGRHNPICPSKSRKYQRKLKENNKAEDKTQRLAPGTSHISRWTQPQPQLEPTPTEEAMEAKEAKEEIEEMEAMEAKETKETLLSMSTCPASLARLRWQHCPCFLSRARLQATCFMFLFQSHNLMVPSSGQKQPLEGIMRNNWPMRNSCVPTLVPPSPKPSQKVNQK